MMVNQRTSQIEKTNISYLPQNYEKISKPFREKDVISKTFQFPISKHFDF